jgi:uncharacterized protein YlxW (UPF0749 family)
VRVSRRFPRRPLLVVVGAVLGFLVVVATQLHPADPESRLPERFRLTALIQRQQRENDEQRSAVEDLERQLASERTRGQSGDAESVKRQRQLDAMGLTAGLVSMRGQGFVVSLDDSSLAASPTGNVNDLVIHSQDVQAVVNGLWEAGAEAISINGQRLVSSSAVLCVGNTLLINGTVNAPPYEVTAIGADRTQFLDDALVRQLRADAERFSLHFSIGGLKQVEVPKYSGSVTPKYATVAGLSS